MPETVAWSRRMAFTGAPLFRIRSENSSAVRVPPAPTSVSTSGPSRLTGGSPRGSASVGMRTRPKRRGSVKATSAPLSVAKERMQNLGGHTLGSAGVLLSYDGGRSPRMRTFPSPQHA